MVSIQEYGWTIYFLITLLSLCIRDDYDELCTCLFWSVPIIHPFNLHPDFSRVASVQIFFRKQSTEHPRKIRAWWRPRIIRVHPTKVWVDFTGYPSNHFSGCKLNWRLIRFWVHENFYWGQFCEMQEFELLKAKYFSQTLNPICEHMIIWLRDHFPLLWWKANLAQFYLQFGNFKVC